MNAKDAINPDWLESYKLQRELLHRELVTFNIRLFTLEKLEVFPFKVFLPDYADRIFWQTVRNALIEAIIIVGWRIVIDTDGDTLTLRRFKNEMFEHLRDQAARDYLRNSIREVEFEAKISQLEEKVTHARNNYVAHLNKDLQVEPDPQKIADLAIRLSDMKQLLGTARQLFDALCFDEHHELYLWDYSTSARQNRTTDIDRLLDDVVRGSYVFNLPESKDNARAWRSYRDGMSPEAVSAFNEYRKRLGKPEIT